MIDTVVITTRQSSIISRGKQYMRVVRLLIRLGALKGRRHKIAEAKAILESHCMGVGA